VAQQVHERLVGKACVAGAFVGELQVLRELLQPKMIFRFLANHAGSAWAQPHAQAGFLEEACQRDLRRKAKGEQLPLRVLQAICPKKARAELPDPGQKFWSLWRAQTLRLPKLPKAKGRAVLAQKSGAQLVRNGLQSSGVLLDAHAQSFCRALRPGVEGWSVFAVEVHVVGPLAPSHKGCARGGFFARHHAPVLERLVADLLAEFLRMLFQKSQDGSTREALGPVLPQLRRASRETSLAVFWGFLQGLCE